MKYGTQIQKMANKMNVQEKINKLHEDTFNFVDYKYSEIRSLFDKLESEVNKILAEGCTNEDTISMMCRTYVEIDYSLIGMFDIIDKTDKIFKEQLEEIQMVYVNACGMFSRSKTEVIQNAFCYICKFRKDYINWLTEVIFQNASELDNRHEGLKVGLNYIFEKMNDDEEENEEIEESVISKTRKLYIAKSRDLEQIALENGYVFKSQNASSHKKYEHTKTKKCVIIPIHNKDIGLGLSYKIQQEILANAI